MQLIIGTILRHKQSEKASYFRTKRPELGKNSEKIRKTQENLISVTFVVLPTPEHLAIAGKPGRLSKKGANARNHTQSRQSAARHYCHITRPCTISKVPARITI